MPIYEFYCQRCDGIFEALRPMREASEAVPCPECYLDAPRIMPTSFAAFTMRDGYPRRIPDRGTYLHLGQEVRRPINEATPPNEHPDLLREKDRKQRITSPSRAQVEGAIERQVQEVRQEKDLQSGYKKDYQYLSVMRNAKNQPPALEH